MATSTFWGGRSRYATRRSRTHRSSVSEPKQHKGQEEAEVRHPDAVKVRRRRVAYYSVSPLERRRLSNLSSSKTKSRASGASGSPKASRTSVKEKQGKAERQKPKHPASEGERRTEDYVYNSPTHPVLDPIIEEGSGPLGESREDIDRSSRRHRSARRHSNHVSLDEELTPSDSISQVGAQSSTKRRRESAFARPALRRSSTTSTRLDRKESNTIRRRDADPTSRRSSRSEQTLLGSVFRRHSTTSIPQAPRLVECLTCGSDDVPSTKSAKLACGHRMCHDCLRRVFEMSVKDPAHMPPKCCTDQHIPLTHVDKLFDTKFKILWNRKYQEYHTKDRLYCPTPKCGHWIKPAHIHSQQGRKFATCPRCRTKVCALCNNKMHRSSECPKDPEIAKLVEQAKKEGWQRCYSCKAFVERKEGCNHMTCRCMAEFCIVCGSKWKSCDCPWFNYAHLPNPDRLNDMRIPEPIQVIYRQVFRAAADALPPPAAERHPPRRGPPAEVTYQQEIDRRQRQERLDADLARRLQLASLMEPDEDLIAPRRRHGEREDIWGLGNAARHFLNDDFVQNAANVVMDAFGDANIGRRGERASRRRRRAHVSEQNSGEPGLPSSFLGDESVLGVQPARSPR